MAPCDGAVRFISATIDGAIYAKLIATAGSSMSNDARQFPVSLDNFVPRSRGSRRLGGR